MQNDIQHSNLKNMTLILRRHDTQHKDTQEDDTQLNAIQHNNTKHNNTHHIFDTQHNKTVIILSEFMLSVPFYLLLN
jgi:hypothetical protein